MIATWNSEFFPPTHLRSPRTPCKWRCLLFQLVGMLVFATFGVARAGAQIPLPNPDLDLLTNGTVYAIATQPDGGVVFGGGFSAVDGEPRSNIARLSPNGQLDPAWNPAADDAVFALAIGVDGAVYAGGAFRTIGGHPRIAIARLAGASGQLDAPWDPFLPDNTLVYALTLSADGDVFAACSYVRGFVTKLSRDEGKPVTEFTTAYVGDSTYVHALALGADGALYAGGTFGGIGAYTRDRVARLSATTGEVDGDWTAQLPGTTADGVATLVADAHGALFVGGPFGVQKLASPIAGEVGSWHTAPADVRALALGEDDSLYVGGYFVSIGGAARRNLARLSPETGAASPDWTADASWYVYALAPKADGGLLAGGAFDDIAGDERLALAAISPNGSVAPAVADVESPGAVFALTAQPDGGTIVGGAFHRVGSVPRRNILRLDTQGLLDPLWNPGVDFQPWSLAVHGDETVYAAGVGFYASDGSQTFAIRKMSGFGTGDVDTGWSVAPDGWVDAMLVADGSLFVGGAFETIGGAAIPRLARLSETTALADPTWDAGVACCAVHALALGDDATLYVGGDFARIGGEARRSLARISIDSAVADPLWDPSPDGYIYALARAGDGAIYAGGQFLFIGGDYRHLLAKLSPTGVGAIDGQWQANLGGLGSDPPDLFQYAGPLAVDANGTLYATGRFYLDYDLNVTPAARFSGVNGAADRGWQPVPWWANVYAVATATSNAVTLGGNFLEAADEPRFGLVAYETSMPDAIFTDGLDGPP